VLPNIPSTRSMAPKASGPAWLLFMRFACCNWGPGRAGELFFFVRGGAVRTGAGARRAAASGPFCRAWAPRSADRFQSLARLMIAADVLCSSSEKYAVCAGPTTSHVTLQHFSYMDMCGGAETAYVIVRWLAQRKLLGGTSHPHSTTSMGSETSRSVRSPCSAEAPSRCTAGPCCHLRQAHGGLEQRTALPVTRTRRQVSLCGCRWAAVILVTPQ